MYETRHSPERRHLPAEDVRPLAKTRTRRAERPKRSYRQAFAKNESLFCSFNGCGNHRFKLSAYCQDHLAIERRVLFHGHENGRRIRRTEYSSELSEVTELMTLYPEHKAIMSAIECVSEWLKRATTSLDCTARRIALRLVDAGVEPQAVLIEVTAAWLYWWNRRSFVREKDGWNGKRTLPLHLGWCANALAKHDGQYISHLAALDLGKMLLERLGAFFVNVARSLDKKHERIAERENSLAEPIE